MINGGGEGFFLVICFTEMGIVSLVACFNFNPKYDYD